MNLFESQDSETAAPSNVDGPLAFRMRPRSLDEFVGQEHLLGPGRSLRRAIESGRMGSAVFFGPPGCGKTALAHLIAAAGRRRFETLNAVTAGIPELREVLIAARDRRKRGESTLLFIDELHRFNKTQQSALLADLESGVITLIGASTENPFFAIIPALASRLRLFELKALDSEDLGRILTRALSDPRGLGAAPITLDSEAETILRATCAGDARRMLNHLEQAVLAAVPAADGSIGLDPILVSEALGRKPIVYDRGDDRYDTVSAFIKSMRGSDADAAVYWLAKMIESGEDPLYIARRIIICASEDVGNADPMALTLAAAAFQAVSAVGLPEGRIPLAQAATYIATAPKSNAVIRAIDGASEEIRSGPVMAVPDHLKDSHYEGAKALGRGVGYRYPHDDPRAKGQAYLPEARSYYRPEKKSEDRPKPPLDSP